MLSTFSELCEKEVINVCNGKRLGHVVDIEFDLQEGCVTAIIVPGPSRWWGLLKGERDYFIPWKKICKIGVDIILVEHEFKGES